MRAREYVEKVMQYVEADDAVKKRLSEDLLEHIRDAGGDRAIESMGCPKDMASELMDSLYADKSEVIRELVRTKAEFNRYGGPFLSWGLFWEYEYISKQKLFGLPLVHIRFKRNRPLKPAKGIIAVGLNSVGVISVGAFSTGLLSVGAASLGLLAVGGIAAGGFALGGIALGIMAIGGIAAGVYTIGGVSAALRIAVGGWASGTVAIGGTAEGMHTIATGGTNLRISEVSRQEVQDLIRQAYPNVSNFIMRLMTSMFR